MSLEGQKEVSRGLTEELKKLAGITLPRDFRDNVFTLPDSPAHGKKSPADLSLDELEKERARLKAEIKADTVELGL